MLRAVVADHAVRLQRMNNLVSPRRFMELTAQCIFFRAVRSTQFDAAWLSKSSWQFLCSASVNVRSALRP